MGRREEKMFQSRERREWDGWMNRRRRRRRRRRNTPELRERGWNIR